MENFNIMLDSSVTMSVTQIFRDAENRKYAFVTFDAGKKSAEGKIPDCTIIRSKGFSDDEIHDLEQYMMSDLDTIWDAAKGVNVFKSFMK